MISHSPFEYSYLLLPLIGFIIGLFGSMLGGGGGFFFLPILTLLFDVPAHSAVATSLAATIPICFVGSITHYRKGNVHLKIGYIFFISGIIGALCGAALAHLMAPSLLKISFGTYALLLAIYLTWNTYQRKNDQDIGNLSHASKNGMQIAKGSFFGVVSGAIAGAFGTSGTAPVMAGLFALKIPVKEVVGTSLIAVLVNAVFALGAHFFIGEIDMTVVYFLTIGSIIGALAGPGLLSKSKIPTMENSFRYGLALVMVVIGILMIVNK